MQLNFGEGVEEVKGGHEQRLEGRTKSRGVNQSDKKIKLLKALSFGDKEERKYRDERNLNRRRFRFS